MPELKYPMTEKDPTLTQWLEFIVKNRASDFHMGDGVCPAMRLDGVPMEAILCSDSLLNSIKIIPARAMETTLRLAYNGKTPIKFETTIHCLRWMDSLACI